MVKMMKTKRTLIKITSLMLTAVMLISSISVFFGCSKEDSPSSRIKGKDTVPTFLFSFDNIEITGGDTYRIIPKFSAETDITYDQIRYSVIEGDDVVSMNGYYVTALKGGTATILAEYVSDLSVYSVFTVKVDMKDNMYKISDYVYASQKGGMYSKPFSLTLSPSSNKYTIYYTLDCSTPTTKSKKYTEALAIFDNTKTSSYPLTKSVLNEPIDGAGQGKSTSGSYLKNIIRTGKYPKVGCGTVITYSVYEGDKLLETSSVTYIVKSNADKYFTVPVVCLSMPYDDWFDNEKGIYNICYHDLKARAFLEYYDLTSGESFKVNTSVKVGGGWTRGLPKKTLNLNFKKDENGNKNAPTDVAFFGEATMDGDSTNLLSAISRLRLHNSGNTYESGNMFGDAFFQKLAEGTNCSTASYRPCLVYLNGEFWGYYGLREHYNDSFFENNYGVNNDDVVVANWKSRVWSITEGDPDDGELFLDALQSYYKKADFRKDSVYNEFIENYIDKDSFIDAMILEAYAHNWDYVENENNLRMWRTSVKKEGVPYYDGKWRICMHDLDFALQHNSGNYLVPQEYTSTKSNDHSYDKYPLFHKLLTNKSFRADLVARLKELFETTFAPDRALEILDKMVKELEPFFDDNAERWGMDYTKESWLQNIDVLRNRLVQRAKYFVITTLSMYEPFEENASKLVTVDNRNSDSSANNSEEFKINSKNFEVDFTVNNDSYTNNDSRAFIRFTSGTKYFKIYWGTGISSKQWMSGAIAEGGDNKETDYVNIGKHNFHIAYKNGTVTLTIDDYFTRVFTVTDEFTTVDAFTFGSMQCKISCNNIKVLLYKGSGKTEEIIY